MTPWPQQLRADVGGLRPGQRLDPVVDLAQRDLGVLDGDVEAQSVGAAQLGAHAGGGDERLGRDAVEQDAGTADAVGVDDGHLYGRSAGRGDAGLPHIRRDRRR